MLNTPRQQGCSIIFVNKDGQVLLYRRDDKRSIPEPNTWDLFGGHIEAGERPEEAIVREVGEEIGIRGKADMGIRLTNFHAFRIYSFADRDEHTYWSRLNEQADNLLLFEGQELRWISEDDLKGLTIAFGFDHVLRDFFGSKPHTKDGASER